ncbi:MAG: Trm112 family protein [Nitrososphaerota archaeon]|jgi:uncharacterized protein YbaR (Trm112 family)|nr:Trm112 family protein [Nitrososphaerota archaeon]
MNHALLDILACPTDGFFPLDVHIFEETADEIISGILVCSKCLRWYPIRGKIPELFPDDLRDKDDEVKFLYRWQETVPKFVLAEGINLLTKSGSEPV